MLDKIEPPPIPDGYGVTVSFHSLLELVVSIRTLVLGDVDEKNKPPVKTASDTKASVENLEEKESDSGCFLKILIFLL